MLTTDTSGSAHYDVFVDRVPTRNTLAPGILN